MTKEIQLTHQPTNNNNKYDGVFRKSTFSADGGCVEVAKDKNGVRVRDTKNRQGSVLHFTHDEWKAFLAGVRKGEFNI